MFQDHGCQNVLSILTFVSSPVSCVAIPVCFLVEVTNKVIKMQRSHMFVFSFTNEKKEVRKHVSHFVSSL